MEDLGIVRHHHWLLYGWHHGFGRGWLPDVVQRVIVHAWNVASCRLLGHDDYGMGDCVQCLKKLPADPAVLAAMEENMQKHLESQLKDA